MLRSSRARVLTAATVGVLSSFGHSSANASTLFWKDPTTSSAPASDIFNSSANWQGGVAPGVADTANFFYGAGAPRDLGTLSLSSSTTLGNLYVGNNAPVTLNTAGFNLNVGGETGNITPTGTLTFVNSGTAGLVSSSLVTVSDGALFTLDGAKSALTARAFDIGVRDPAEPEPAADVANVVLRNGSTLTITDNNLNIGASKSGNLTILSGSKVVGPFDWGDQTTVGARRDGTNGYAGTLSVAGAGSSFTGGRLVVGGAGDGVLNVINGASLNVKDLFIGYYAGSKGNVNIAGGSVTAGNMITVNQSNNPTAINFTAGTLTLSGQGLYTSSSYVQNNLTVGDGTQTAALNVGGNLQVAGGLMIQANAVVNVSNSLSASTLTGAGSLNWVSGSITLISPYVIGSTSLISSSLALGGAVARSLTLASTLTLEAGTDISVQDNGYLYLSKLTGPGSLTYKGGSLISEGTPLSTTLLNNSSIALTSAGRTILAYQGLTVAAGDTLTVGGGTLRTYNPYAAVNTAKGLTIAPTGGVVLSSGLVQVGSITSTTGAIAFTGGILQVLAGSLDTDVFVSPITTVATSGAVSVSNTLGITSGTTVVVAGGILFAKEIVNAGELLYSSGSVTSSLGTLDFSSAGSTVAPSGGAAILRSTGATLSVASGSITLPSSDTHANVPIVIGNGSLTLHSLTMDPGSSLSFASGASGAVSLATASITATAGGTFGTAGLPDNGRLTLATTVISGGAVAVGAGQTLRVTDSTTVAPNSTLTLAGGTLSFFHQTGATPSLFNGLPSGYQTGYTTSLDDVETRAGSFSGAFAWTAGTLEVAGTFTDANFSTFLAGGTLGTGKTLLATDWNATQALTVTGTLLADDIRNANITLGSGARATADLVTGGTITTQTGSFLNIYRLINGSVNGPNGTINVRYREITSQPTSDIIGQNISLAASVTLSAGIRAVGRTQISTGAKLSGGGNSGFDVQKELTNSGTLSPGNSPGIFTVQGNYIQDSAGKLLIELAGGATPGTDFDQLVVTALDATYTGSATLSGILDLDSYNGYLGKLGDSFRIVDAVSLSGAFTTFDTSGAGLFNAATTHWAVVYDYPNGDVYAKVVSASSPASSGIPVAVPEPAGLSALALVALPLVRRRRR